MLLFVSADAESFIELGCRTDYFTEVILDRFPAISGVLVDASQPVLDQMRDRMGTNLVGIEVVCSPMERLDWSTIANASLAFSAFAIHHPPDAEKWKLFGKICVCLRPEGIFVLFDSFRPGEPTSDALLEHLSCMTIKPRVEADGKSGSIEQIIARDRQLKAAAKRHSRST